MGGEVTMGRKPSQRICVAEGCDQPQRARNLCPHHYSRDVRGLPLDMPKHEKLHGGRKRKLHRGYVIITRNGRDVEEHRVIMEEWLGRPLATYEVIHHIDGNKTNNAIDNLEVHTRGSHRALHNTQDMTGKKYRSLVACLFDQCPRWAQTRGYCYMHYRHIRKYSPHLLLPRVK